MKPTQLRLQITKLAVCAGSRLMAQLNLGSRKIRCLSLARGGIYFAASLPGVEKFPSQAKAFKGQKRFDH